MLPLYHILLLISSDWMGPEAGTGYFCASTSVKPRAVVRERARERNTGRSGREREIELREKEIEGWTIPVFLIARYPPGIFIIRDLVRKTSRRIRTSRTRVHSTSLQFAILPCTISLSISRYNIFYSIAHSLYSIPFYYASFIACKAKKKY